MQDRYTDDIGDYGKYILLNSLAGSTLRLAVVWCLNPVMERSADGKFTEYLNETGERRYRQACPHIYDVLREIVRSGNRRVSAVKKEGILPIDTIFYEVPLDYPKFRLIKERKRAREEWLYRALSETSEARLVFFDPDNGLAVKSHPPHTKTGAKYVFDEEIRAFWERNQGIVIYQHLNRSGNVGEQARRGLARLCALTDGSEGWAIGFHSHSVRLYFVVPSKNHASDLRERTRKLGCGPCKSILGVKLYAL